MIPIAICVSTSNRKKLIEQTLRTLKENTLAPYKLFIRNGMVDGEMKTMNSLVKSIDYDWTWLVRSDDDMFFSKGWLTEMLDALKDNPDVWLLGGCKYPTHKVLEEREKILITEIQAGNHWLIPRWVWDKFGPFYENFIQGQAEDVRFCKTLQGAGGRVGAMKDNKLVVHCGITGTSGRGRSEGVEKYMRDLCREVGAYCE